MKLIIKLFGILAILSGVLLLINPKIIFGWIEKSVGNTSLYILAIVVRLVFGFIFIIGSKESKYPGVIKIFGYLTILTAIIFIFIGQENYQDFFYALIPEIKPYSLLISVIDIAIGGFLIYAFSRNKELNK